MSDLDEHQLDENLTHQTTTTDEESSCVSCCDFEKLLDVIVCVLMCIKRAVMLIAASVSLASLCVALLFCIVFKLH